VSNEIDTAVNDILTQIKSHNKDTTDIKKVADEIDLDNLEEFLVKKTSSLINSSVDMVDDVKEYIASAPENRDVASLAELIKASSSAIDTLSKLHTAKEQNKNRVEIKQMDIESKEKLNIMDNQTKVLMTRDDVMKALTGDDGTVIDID
jgi:hypothetical protein|tara:strand:+ start:1801 stop:2247 length:447 start_codon:yes stop_codon:yes gene_type:complete